LEALRSAKEQTVVVATDVAARGLDITSVSTVIHYDAARNVNTFVHRSGRTAVSRLVVVPIVASMMNTMVYGLESLKYPVETNIVPLAV